MYTGSKICKRHKAFERLVKLEKGEVTGHTRIIMTRHLTSQKLSTSLVKEYRDTSWIVTSSDKRHEYYVTQKVMGVKFSAA